MGGPQNNTMWSTKGDGRKGSNTTQIEKQHDRKKVANTGIETIIVSSKFAALQNCYEAEGLEGCS